MSIEKRINYLMQRCLDQVETMEERTELETYYKAAPHQEHVEEALLSAFYQDKVLIDMDKDKQDQVLTAIKSAKVIQPKARIAYLKWASIAAVFLMLLSPFIMNMGKFELPELTWKRFSISHNTDTIVESVEPISLDQPPARDLAVLELADGNKFELENLKSGTQVLFEDLIMERTKQGVLQIRSDAKLSQGKVISNQYHTIRTPRGGTQKLLLADGTMVQLNSDSKFSFPTTFATAERRVVLAGEGYFEVAKDPKKRFIVSSGRDNTEQEVLVYGTTFNIAAYPEDKEITTTLVEGSVKIKGVKDAVEKFLKPNEFARLNASGLEIARADLASILAWKDDMFYFNNERLENVMKQLSRWYDVDIKYEGDITDNRFWGQVSRRKNLTEMLNILEKTNQIKFQIQGKEVTVMN